MRKIDMALRFCHAEVVDGADDDRVDEALIETFPASDAPANTPETGIQARPVAEPGGGAVRHDPEARRFVLGDDTHEAFLQYDDTAHGIVILHTEVPAAMRGRNVGGRLAEAALAWARAQARPLTIVCPFVRAYVKRHPR